MSIIPPGPTEPQPILNYATQAGYGSAPTLVLLAGIFNLIMGGLNAINALLGVAGAVIVCLPPGTVFRSGPMGPGSSPPAFRWLMLAMYVGTAAGSAIVGALEVAAGIGFLRKRSWAWRWGLAAAIGSCCELWCGLPCILPMACGIYTLVALLLPNTREYLKNGGIGMDPVRGFSVN